MHVSGKEGLAGWPMGLLKHFPISLWTKMRHLAASAWSKSLSLMCLSLRIFKTVILKMGG